MRSAFSPPERRTRGDGLPASRSFDSPTASADEPRVGQGGAQHRELALAPIDQEQVRQRLAVGAGQAAPEHLPQGRVIVVRSRLPDAIAAVVLLAGLAVLEADAARHGQRAVQRGDVVALDPPRKRAQGEPVPQLRERRVDALARLEPAHEGELRVAFRHLDELDHRAAPRCAQADLPTGALGQQALQRAVVADRLGSEHLVGDLALVLPPVVLPEEGAHHLAVVEADVGEGVVLRSHHAPFAHVEHLDAGLAALARQAEDVPVHRPLAHDLLPLDRPLHRARSGPAAAPPPRSAPPPRPPACAA